MLPGIAHRSRASAAGLPPAGTSRGHGANRRSDRDENYLGAHICIGDERDLYALGFGAGHGRGWYTGGLTSPPSSISSGSYGTGFYGPGLTGPGSYGPRSYGPGSYGPGTGASTGPPTPFTYFTQGGPAAGGVAVPSAPSQ